MIEKLDEAISSGSIADSNQLLRWLQQYHSSGDAPLNSISSTPSELSDLETLPDLEVLFDALTVSKFPGIEETIAASFKLIALPGERIDDSNDLASGDILLRRGAHGTSIASVITAPRRYPREQLKFHGLTPEGDRLGQYIQVVEAGFDKRISPDLFARRITSEEGYLPPDQLILRVKRDSFYSDELREDFADSVFVDRHKSFSQHADELNRDTEKFDLEDSSTEGNSRPLRILSIDGGGLRGIIPATFLDLLEKMLGEPLYKYFDFVAGTSTGGLIALALTTKKPGTQKPYTAKEIVDLYFNEGKHIFPHASGSLQPEKGTFDLQGKSLAKGINRVLKEYFGDAQFKDTIKPCLVVSYKLGETTLESTLQYINSSGRTLSRASALSKMRPVVVPSRRMHAHYFISPIKNSMYRVRDVARATSAAPTYLRPAVIASGNSKDIVEWHVDGGLVANNPSLTALTYLTGNHKLLEGKFENNKRYQKKHSPQDFLVVSLGTGHYPASSKSKIFWNEEFYNAINWSKLSWAPVIPNAMFDAQGRLVDGQMRNLFSAKRDNYFRFDVELPKPVALDDKKQVGYLRKLVYSQVSENKASVTDILQKLVVRLKKERKKDAEKG